MFKKFLHPDIITKIEIYYKNCNDIFTKCKKEYDKGLVNYTKNIFKNIYAKRHFYLENSVKVKHVLPLVCTSIMYNAVKYHRLEKTTNIIRYNIEIDYLKNRLLESDITDFRKMIDIVQNRLGGCVELSTNPVVIYLYFRILKMIEYKSEDIQKIEKCFYYNRYSDLKSGYKESISNLLYCIYYGAKKSPYLDEKIKMEINEYFIKKNLICKL